MNAKALIDGGICGFQSKVSAQSIDGQMVRFKVASGCDKIVELGTAMEGLGEIDAYAEITPTDEGVVMKTVREHLKGCCAGCAVPVGIFKSMQVAAGLALPKEVILRITAE